MKLMNKVAIVTGTASGIGQGIAHGFVAEGAKVAVADIHHCDNCVASAHYQLFICKRGQKRSRVPSAAIAATTAW